MKAFLVCHSFLIAWDPPSAQSGAEEEGTGLATSAKNHVAASLPFRPLGLAGIQRQHSQQGLWGLGLLLRPQQVCQQHQEMGFTLSFQAA